MSRTRVSACLIAKNERESVRPCLESFGDHADEIVFCDTGSRDGTVAAVRQVCRERGWLEKLVVGRFRWCDDFAAARNHAASLATGDVHLWVDLDDRLVGAENLPSILQAFEKDHQLGALEARYIGMHYPERDIGCPMARHVVSWRTRLFRAPVRWRDPTWEEVDVRGDSRRIDPAVLYWQHVKVQARRGRDERIARRWLEREPDSVKALDVLAAECRYEGAHEEAVDLADRLLAHPDSDRLLARPSRRSRAAFRCGVLGLKAASLFMLGRLDEAVSAGRAAAKTSRQPQAACIAWEVLANAACRRGDFIEARHWCDLLLSEKAGAVVELQYRISGCLILAAAEANVGHYTAACNAAERAARLAGGDARVLPCEYESWRARSPVPRGILRTVHPTSTRRTKALKR